MHCTGVEGGLHIRVSLLGKNLLHWHFPGLTGMQYELPTVLLFLFYFVTWPGKHKQYKPKSTLRKYLAEAPAPPGVIQSHFYNKIVKTKYHEITVWDNEC